MAKIFVVHAYKDGGAMGFDEWALVAVRIDRSDAEAVRSAFMQSRLDRRWEAVITAMDTDAAATLRDRAFYDAEKRRIGERELAEAERTAKRLRAELGHDQ